MKKLFTLIFTFTTISIFSQAPGFQWAKNLSGPSAEWGHSVATDAAGNVFTTGRFIGVVDFDPGVGTFTLNGYSSGETFVSKLDANGNFVWAKQFVTNTYGSGESICTDALGNVLIGGIFQGTVDFDPGVGTYTLGSSGANDAFTIKLSNNGNFVWAKSMGGPGTDECHTIITDAANNVYTTGEYEGDVDFDPGPGTFTMSSISEDGYLTKLDANGNFVWAKRIVGSTVNDRGWGLNIDGSGNIYTTGYFQGTSDFDPGVGVFNLTSFGGQDVFVSKLDGSGNFVWAVKIGGAAGEGAYSISSDPSGNVLIGGWFNGTTDFDPGVGTYNLTSSGLFDAFVVKLNSSGSFLWATKFGSTGNDESNTVTFDLSGNAYTIGYFQGTVDFDPGVGIFNLTAVSGSDIFISKLNSNGTFGYALSLGGTATDVGHGIFIDSNNSIYTTGNFGNTVDFDPGVGSFTLTGGSIDIFVQKLSQCFSPAAPTNTTPALNQTICSNNTTSLIASGSGTITWYATPSGTTVLGTGTTYITPSLTVGTYIYYAEAATCTISASRTPITVTVNPSPTVTAATSTNVLCIGNTATLTANGATNYTWNPGGAGASIVISPSINATYTVQGADVNGCQNATVITQSVTNCSTTGLSTLSSLPTSEVLAYPNPTKGLITLELINFTQNANIEIYNNFGSLVFSKSFVDGKQIINLNGLSNGIYMVIVKNNTTTEIKRIIIE